jgi:NAD(P)-dependent dehydrogenase (short-subunit alcohol dehydrogenase family)
MSERDLRSKFDLSGKTVIITGGAGLLGTSHSHALAAAGASVVVADIQGERAQAAADEVRLASGSQVLAVQVDVSQPDSVEAMVEETLRAFGSVDVLVNNAALDPKFDAAHQGQHTNRFEDFPVDAWRQAMDVNVTGMFLCARAVATPMRQSGRGSIINVASTYGLVGPDQRLYQRQGQPPTYKPVTYSVSKAAALGLTRYLATYFAGTQIRVNALTPGGVFAGHDDEFVARYSARTVLGRMADPEEISAALLFLASEASSYMTGANLVVDGGWTAW